MPLDDPNVGLAFGLTVAAGGATALGAAVVFVPRLVRLASRRTLAAALSLSAGVMTYVSFVEIAVKSLTKFQEAGHSDDMAYVYATVCFFAGVVIMMLLNFIVTALLGGHHHHGHEHGHGHGHGHGHDHCDEGKFTRHCTQSSEAKEQEQQPKEEMIGVSCPCCSDDPVGELEQVQRMAEEMEKHCDQEQTEQMQQEPDQAVDPSEGHGNLEDFHDVAQQSGESPNNDDGEVPSSEDETTRDVENLINEKDKQEDENRKQLEQQKLLRMSVNTAIAIGLHNFPEGLATFLSTLADPSVGVVLAVAIAIHNIPEGICVAMPVYYATGSRWKAFGWAVLSGLSEPFAALLGWAILAGLFSDTLYAILFGIVAGMMVIISIRELVPTAHRYDPEDTVVTYFFILGMAIMALSLVLFKIY